MDQNVWPFIKDHSRKMKVERLKKRTKETKDDLEDRSEKEYA